MDFYPVVVVHFILTTKYEANFGEAGHCFGLAAHVWKCFVCLPFLSKENRQGPVYCQYHVNISTFKSSDRNSRHLLRLCGFTDHLQQPEETARLEHKLMKWEQQQLHCIYGTEITYDNRFPKIMQLLLR